MGSWLSRSKALVCIPASSANLTLFFIPPIAQIIGQYLGDIWLEKYNRDGLEISDDMPFIQHHRNTYDCPAMPEFDSVTIYPTQHPLGKLEKMRLPYDNYVQDGLRHHITRANVSAGLHIVSCCNTISIYDTDGGFITQGELDYIVFSETMIVAPVACSPLAPFRIFTLVWDGKSAMVALMLVICDVIDGKLVEVAAIPVWLAAKIRASNSPQWCGVLIDN